MSLSSSEIRPDSGSNADASAVEAPSSGDPRGAATAGVDAPAAERAPIEIVVLALVACAAGVALRFVTRSPLWLDEALSVNIARLPLGDILPALRQDGHPPLYYLLLHGWMEVFGTSDTAVRALSGVIGVLTLPLAWFAGRRRGGPLLGWLLVAVLALSPYAVRYSNETRMYSLVILFVLCGYLLVDDVVRRGREGLGRLLGIGVVSGLLLLTHYWSMWLLGAVVVVLGVAWRRATDEAVRRAALRAGVAVIAGGLLFAWWLPTMLYQSAHTGTPWASADRPTVSFSSALADFAAGALPDAPVIIVASSLLFALGAFGVARGARHIDVDVRTSARFRPELAVLAITFVIGLLVNLASGSAFQSRYGAVFFPLYLLVVAGGLLCFSSRPIRAGVLAGVLVLYGVAVVYNGFVFQRSQSRVAAERIAEVAKPGDVVVLCPDQLGPSFGRELGDGYTSIAYPTGGAPDRVDWVDYAQRNAAAGDPAAVQAFADRVLQAAGPDRGIAVVWGGTYKTLEGQCEALLGRLGAVRPGGPLVNAQPEKFYEPANVTWYAPTSP